MNSKKRYIPIIALGALILSLLAILPVAAADEVEFIDPTQINTNNDGTLTGDDPTPNEQEWARQGGLLGIRLTDSDVAVRHVLLPGVDTEEIIASGGAVAKNSRELTLGANHTDEDANRAGLQYTKVRRNDLVMIGLHTLRKVEKVEIVDTNNDSTAATPDLTDDVVKLTLDRPYPQLVAYTNAKVDIVKRTYVTSSASAYNAFDGDGYKNLAAALRWGDSQVTVGAFDAVGTNITLDRDVADSGVGDQKYRYNNSEDNDLGLRLRSSTDNRVRPDDDIHVTQVSAGSVTAETYPLTYGSGGRGVDEGGPFAVQAAAGDRTSGHDDAYVVFWASVKTHHELAIKSRAHTSPMHLMAGETTVNSGQFAALVRLVPDKVTTSWANIPAGDAGAEVTLTAEVDGLSDLKVVVPARPARPSTVDEDTPEVTVETVAQFDIEIPRLPVKSSDVVNVRSGVSENISVETKPAVFSSLAPQHNNSSRNDRPELSARVADNESGLAEDKIEFIYTIDDGAVQKIVPDDDGDVTEEGNGFEVTARVARPADDTNEDRVIKWWVKATDKAGNVSFSDRLPTKNNNPDVCSVIAVENNADATNDRAVDVNTSKCDPYIVRIDNSAPSMALAETGRFWDASLSTGDSEDKTEYRAKNGKETSILVVFSEHLDLGSVQASDFEVNDARPISARPENVTVRDDVFQSYRDSQNPLPEGETDDTVDDPSTGDGNKAIAGDEVQDVGEDRGYVFLTVNEFTPNARPKVELVDNVLDKAGNRRDSGTIQSATDRIAPKLTVAIEEGVRPVTNKSVTITVTSNEDISSPTVSYRLLDSTSPADGDSVQSWLGEARTVTTVTERSGGGYEAKITPTDDGLYSVFVTADDETDSNAGTIGYAGTIATGDETPDVDLSSDTSAILFERDQTISKPDFDPEKSGVNDTFETDNANGYVRIDYSAEGKEYSTTMHAVDDVVNGDTLTVARSGDDLDTHGRVEIISASFDGEDITGAVRESNSERNIFLYRLNDVGVGDYDLEITVRDNAGNQNTTPHKGKIKVSERKPYKLTLNPGENLVSFPGAPVDPDINAVFPADAGIQSVLSYNPMTPGGWVRADVTGDGLAGTLDTIDHRRAYIVVTDSFLQLEVAISRQDAGTFTLLPTIPIVQGWNLVPIIDVDGDFKLADQTADDNYFSGLTTGSIDVIYSWNTITGTWVSVDEKADDADDISMGVKVGRGYWVYATKPGTIVP